jgi:hypothetical protein
MRNPDRTAWRTVMDIQTLVDTAYGLALIADYDCSDNLCIPAERQAAQAAPMSAARFLLEQAKDLLNDLEPAVSQLEREAEAAAAIYAPAKGCVDTMNRSKCRTAPNYD